jgi:peroxiredoxin
MRSHLLFLLLILGSCAAAQPGRVYLKGSLEHLPQVRTVSLRTVPGLVPITAPVLVRDGRFDLSCQIDAPQLALLSFTGDAPLLRQHGVDDKVYNIPVFLQAGAISLDCRDSLPLARISGSEAHDAYLALMASGAPIERAISHWRELSADSTIRNNAARQRQITRKLDSLEALYREEVFGNFLRRHIGSPLSAWALTQYWYREGDPEQVLSFLVNMPRTMRNSRSMRALEEMAEKMARTAVGMEAPDFTLNDTLGNAVSLASFRGKWVLLQFWASWHLTSRLNNADLVKAFDRYRNRNFTILGVALERQKSYRKYWMEAIHDDSLCWTQVTDFKYWDGPVLKKYGIPGIPFNLLIDPQGKIVARYLRGERLWAKLEQFLEP